MKLSLKPEHLKRYTEIARLLVKYGRSDLASHAGLTELLPLETRRNPDLASATADIANDLEKLGPTFIKLGQLLSTRPDIVPPAYAEALTRLQNNCEPFPYSEVEAIVGDELGFHADPHPGNVFLVEDRIALLDLGMVARVAPHLQERLLQLLLAVTDNRPEDAARVLLQLAQRREGANAINFQRGVTDIIGQHRVVTVVQPQVGRVVLMLLKVAGENGFLLPPEFAMIGKTLLNLDKIGHTLSPKFDPNAAVRRHAAEITEQQIDRHVSIGTLFSAAVELKNFLRFLPGRVNHILDRLADNEFEVKVDAIDEARLSAA